MKSIDNNRSMWITAIVLFIIVTVTATSAKIARAEQSPNLENNNSEQFDRVLTSAVKDKIKRGTYFVLGIEQKLATSKYELDLLRNNVKSLKSKISDTDLQIQNIESQVQNLDNLIDENNEKIKTIKTLIAEHTNGIYTLQDKIIQEENILKKNIDSLSGIFTAYYMQTNSFMSSPTNSPNLLALLSNDEGVEDTIRKNDYLYFIQYSSQELAKEIILSQDDLNKKKTEMAYNKELLQRLSAMMAREERTLAESMDSKQRLLEETRGKQIIYETLLQLSKREEAQVAVQITNLQQNFDFFQTKLDELKTNPSAETLQAKDLSLDEDISVLTGKSVLAWPVSPSGGISAYYHDESYKAAVGIQHNAIDIRVAQGSRVRAAADGIVTKVADNGFAYSYIIIAHPNKMVTLYGHLSEMLVAEGEIVRQGQVIGLSGGIPGTKGAGWLTTGAHLHFEVFNNWQHVDPLEYLPIEYLDQAGLPEKYLKSVFNY